MSTPIPLAFQDPSKMAHSPSGPTVISDTT
jgi:hypothetical protein